MKDLRAVTAGIRPPIYSSPYHRLYRLSILASLDVYQHAVTLSQPTGATYLEKHLPKAPDLIFKLEIREYGGHIWVAFELILLQKEHQLEVFANP